MSRYLSRKWFMTLFFSAFLFSHCSLSLADEIRPAYLEINEMATNQFNILWKIPARGNGVPKINFTLSDFVHLKEIGEPLNSGGAYIYNYQAQSSQTIRGSEIKIEGLSTTMIDTLVQLNFINGEHYSLMLRPDSPELKIPQKERIVQTMSTYFTLGLTHILTGLDHLLFVLALLLITNSGLKLIKTITAFTVAHSITLSLSALGQVSLPDQPVEAAVALSIAFLAVELIHVYRGEQVMTARSPWIVAFCFGLLHGFGFAGALAHIGLPQTTITTALLFFNIGVETGQVLFILLMLVLIYTLKKLDLPQWMRYVTPYMIGSYAVFWLFIRVYGFWG